MNAPAILDRAASVLTATLRHHGVEMHPDDIRGLATDAFALAPINWRFDLSRMPIDRFDGREMLLYAGYVVLCSWCDGWRDPVGRPVQNATHWADVEGPGA
ncbi:hypothetical protein SKP52_02535 [Sphingopyxis fribergensis]|uniref:Uncharacterized protein n=1 Tax=Sphingopyxis fribergensis TaxID=1515612 RepID=A0A0A7PHL2_9SPHN|nr:hypothetical protein [Sphingopyxis fribergensis]AJA07442.1 hypothetical protein SKP52_02535 [Sphingopyxis fribergensis]